MNEAQEVRVLTSEMLDSMSFEDRVEYYKQAGVVEITGGLRHLTHDSNELLLFIQDMLDQNNVQSRFPMLAMKDGSIWMVGHEPSNGKHAHGSILRELGKTESDVDYSVSLEGMGSEPPYLEIIPTEDVGYYKKDRVVRVKIGTRADLPVRGPSFNDSHRSKELDNLFSGIDGVTIKYE